MRIAKRLDELDHGFCYWLAGLVDGEGSFQLKHKQHWWVELTISLRADDLPMLRLIQDELGRGSIYRHPPSRGVILHSKLRYMLRFHSASDTRFIRELFEHYPLRSKKKREFELWAEARKELDKQNLARDLRHLRYLHRAIREIRRYEGPTFEAYRSEGEQASMPLQT